MRPKFRAWDKENNTKLTWEQLKSEADFSWFADDNLVLMQYTGLKDKNGVEIYEGDILEVEKNEDGTYKGTINGKTFFDRFQGYSSKIKVEGMHDINTLRYWNNRVRIIGNIYENPELLKEQNK